MRGSRVLSVLLMAVLAPQAASAAGPKTSVQVIMRPDTAASAKLGSLADCVAVTPDGIAVVGDGDRLWLVGATGARPVAKIRHLRSFAFTPEGLLVGVQGRNLVYLDSRQNLRVFFALPGRGMNVSPGRLDTLFLFGPEDNGGYDLYVVRPGRKVSKVLNAPKPITGVAQAGSRILLVTGGALYGVSEHKLLLIAAEPQGALTSVAVDEAGGRIFVSDGRHIFQVQQGRVVPLAGDLGGTLRWYGGGLLVLDPRNRVLVRLVGLK